MSIVKGMAVISIFLAMAGCATCKPDCRDLTYDKCKTLSQDCEDIRRILKKRVVPVEGERLRASATVIPCDNNNCGKKPWAN